MKINNTVKIFLLYALILILGIVAFSCSSTNKHKTSRVVKTDSTSVTKTEVNTNKAIDSTQVKKNNVVESKESESNWNKKTTIDFSPEFLDDQLVINPYPDTPFYQRKGNNLLVVKDKSKVIVKSNGDIELKETPKKITIEDKGESKTKENKVENNFDSTQLKNTQDSTSSTNTETQLNKKETTSEFTKSKVSYWGWVWLGGGLLITYFIGWYFGWWKWLLLLFKRKRNKDANRRSI